METQEAKSRWRLRKLGKIDYGLFMICVAGWVAYLASGLMHGFSAVPTSFGSAAFVWAEWTGVALIALIISLIVLAASKPSTAWITFLVLVIGSAYISKPQASAAGSTSRATKSVELPSTPPAQKRLTVTEFIQSSQGASESDIGPEFISGIEEFLLKDKQAQYERVMRSIGKEPTVGALTADSQLVRDGTHQLVVTEIKHKAVDDGGTALKIAWWIQADQLKLVQCADTTGAMIALRAGKCGRQIADTFGFSDWLIDE